MRTSAATRSARCSALPRLADHSWRNKQCRRPHGYAISQRSLFGMTGRLSVVERLSPVGIAGKPDDRLDGIVFSLAAETKPQYFECGVSDERFERRGLEVPHIDGCEMAKTRRVTDRREVCQALHRLNPQALQSRESAHRWQRLDLTERLKEQVFQVVKVRDR
jgi:hypothetical protein